ncbi:MAG: universal stress protein [Anaerolineae bacterium]
MTGNIWPAVQDFRRARRRAALEELVARLTGKSAELLSYEDVRRKLKVKGSAGRMLEDIPLDAIVGSVGRYADFTRSFLPRQDSDEHRWARVKAAVTDLVGVPPIEVYQIGDAYFVLDGNHRVSVARDLGATHIQAYVTKVRTKVPLSPDDRPDDVICKARYADFLERTRLDELRPGADLRVTAPGQYRVLEEHIEVHRYFMGLDQQRDIPYEEAVVHWYDEVYLPVVQIIRGRGILWDFPGRTETDLYLWLSEHHAALRESLGWEVEAETAAADLAARFSPRPARVAARLGERILDAVTPDELESGPAPGEWRRQRGRQNRLFGDILVAIGGQEEGWPALELALEVARREGGRLRGLHVVPAEEQQQAEPALAIRQEFEQRCRAAGVPGEAVVDVGGVARTITDRARWTDLVVLHLAHPPGPQPLARLGSGLRTLIRRCARPILAVPEAVSSLDGALLAYDGSPKADEALYVAAYLAGRWQVSLAVVAVAEDGITAAEVLQQARAYLEPQGIEAAFVEESGNAAEAILKTAEAFGSDVVIMGGYGASPVVEVVLGSTVDQVLRQSRKPMLICR